MIGRLSFPGCMYSGAAHLETCEHRVFPATNVSSGLKFQDEVALWVNRTFGPEIAADCVERNHRFLEESLELVQACGCTAEEAHQLVDYVFHRPVGEKAQEVGGVLVTLAALCSAQGVEMDAAGRVELDRIWGCIEKIRAKQATKPKGSPLPGVCAQ